MNQISRMSIHTGAVNIMELPITKLQIRGWLNGEKTAFELFPELNPVQMDFLITGMTPQEHEQIVAELIAEGELEDYERIDAEMAYA